MPTRKELIEELRSCEKLMAECPCCAREFSPAKAVIFDPAIEFPDEAEKAVAVKEESISEKALSLRNGRAALRIKKDTATDAAEKKAMEVNLGLTAEKIVTGWEDFPHHSADCCPLFEPIDYIIFDGLLSKNRLENIAFVDVKTGNSRLTKGQRLIVDAIQDRRIELVVL